MKKKVILSFAAGLSVLALAVPAMAEETESETAAETEVAAEAESDTADSSELSDDIYSFQVKINSTVYTFPMSYSDFTAAGWTCEDDETEEIAPNYYDLVTFENSDGLQAYGEVANLGLSNAALSDCQVVGINIDSYMMEDAPDTTIELPGGIVYGTSTLDDIQAAYGTPTDTYEGDLYTSLRYQYDYYQEVELYVDAETGVLSEIDLENMVADEEANAAAAAEVTDDPTEEVLAYEAPTELGDDLLSFIVEYAGDLYQLPAPVSVFEENGWTIEDDSDSVVAAHSSGWVYMRKDNQSYHALAENYGDSAASIRNCFVLSVESDTYTTDLPITLQKGITRDMTEAEVAAALEGVDYELDDESDTFHYYRIASEESTLDYVEICVNVEDDLVSSIEVRYNPDTLD